MLWVLRVCVGVALHAQWFLAARMMDVQDAQGAFVGLEGWWHWAVSLLFTWYVYWLCWLGIDAREAP